MNTGTRIAIALLFLTLGGCMRTGAYDSTRPYLHYTQRTDTITMTAGNDQAVNTRVQEIDPWPRYVGNTRIPVSGQRMAGAVERYRDVSKLSQAPQPLAVDSTK